MLATPTHCYRQVIFLLGDVFDEGQWVDEDGWNEYVRRFHSIFRRSESLPMVVVPGNHDIGFHYHLTEHPCKSVRVKGTVGGLPLYGRC